MCSRENSIDIIKDSILPYDTSESFKTIVAFDCRGIEPVDFSPRVSLQLLNMLLYFQYSRLASRHLEKLLLKM